MVQWCFVSYLLHLFLYRYLYGNYEIWARDTKQIGINYFACVFIILLSQADKLTPLKWLSSKIFYLIPCASRPSTINIHMSKQREEESSGENNNESNKTIDKFNI